MTRPKRNGHVMHWFPAPPSPRCHIRSHWQNQSLRTPPRLFEQEWMQHRAEHLLVPLPSVLSFRLYVVWYLENGNITNWAMDAIYINIVKISMEEYLPSRMALRRSFLVSQTGPILWTFRAVTCSPIFGGEVFGGEDEIIWERISKQLAITQLVQKIYNWSLTETHLFVGWFSNLSIDV